MAFTKITETDLQNKGVIGLPDTPGLSTTEMQEKFDEIALDVLYPKHNGLIDELALSSAAANIGALDVNNEASTVQAELNKLKQGGYTKAETDALLANKVDTISGKGLSTNDFTDAYKDKLNGIEDNANNYVLPKGSQTSLGGVMGDGTTFNIDSNGVGHAIGGGGGGTSDYNALINKPKINNVEVIGDKSGSDFGFLSPVITITSDAGSTVKIKKGTTVIDAVPVTTTTWKAVPSDYGTWTVSSTLAGADEATGTVTVDAVKQYSVTVEHITATITATYPNDATYCTCSKGSTTYTATSNPQTFTVRATGTWTVETSLNGIVKSATTTITADGDSQSVTIEYADIEVTYDNNFKGKTITCTNGTSTYTKTAPNDANTVSFTIPSTGTWTVRSEVSGTTYSQNVSVLSYTSYSASLAVFNATITITFPYSDGATCTCNSETATSSPYTFNIGSTGTYTATCTLDGVSKTQSFTITTDGQTESHTFEYGTINLTFDNEFRGLTLTCTDSSYTITKTAPSTGNTMVFYPNETNTWTISGTYSGVTYTTTAEVSSLSTPVSAILQTIPDGSTVTPTDSIQTWLKCATINDKSYTTLNEVLADTDTFTVLLQDSNACDYMARSTTWSTDICADADAMSRVGKYDYCSDKLLSNSTWCTAICNSTYFESVLNTKVPTMTDATHPSGVVSASSTYSGHPDYYAFDGNTSNAWYSSLGTNEYIQYQFPNAVIVNKADIGVSYFNGYTRIKNFRIEASNDGTNYTTLYTGLATNNSANYTLTVTFENTTAYTHYRLYVIDNYGPSNYSVAVFELQFYGRHTAQTNIIHSAANDYPYYIDGTSQTLGGTDTSGVGTVNWSNVPVGNLTIYSSVANDPSDLTSAYSKTVRITPHTVEVYVMPDNVVYWYGYINNLVQMTSANGWNRASYGDALAVTYNSNYITVPAGTSSSYYGVGTLLGVTASTVNAIVNPSSSNKTSYTGISSSKSLANPPSESVFTYSTTSGMQKLSKTVTSGTQYLCFFAAYQYGTSLYALWYE